jgi:hypothetical protein
LRSRAGYLLSWTDSLCKRFLSLVLVLLVTGVSLLFQPLLICLNLTMVGFAIHELFAVTISDPNRSVLDEPLGLVIANLLVASTVAMVALSFTDKAEVNSRGVAAKPRIIGKEELVKLQRVFLVLVLVLLAILSTVLLAAQIQRFEGCFYAVAAVCILCLGVSVSFFGGVAGIPIAFAAGVLTIFIGMFWVAWVSHALSTKTKLLSIDINAVNTLFGLQYNVINARVCVGIAACQWCVSRCRCSW